MAGGQPAWVRRRGNAEQETAVLGPSPARGAFQANRYGTPPVWLLAGLTVLLPIVAFVLLLTGQTVVAAALALVAFVLAIMFGPETRQALRLAGYAGWQWSTTAGRVGGLRIERRRNERRLDGALRELGSATYSGDDERTRLAQARAHEAAAALARVCDEEARLVEETRTRVAQRRRRRR
jgi:hypothetical protein